MADWKFLNEHRCVKPEATVHPTYVSTSADGFNGMFRFVVKSQTVRCVASDGAGWRHVSVSIEYSDKTPDWDTMCRVKDLFFEDTDWVVQFHPPKKEYVNLHPGCLHLWQYIGGGPFQMPTPHHLLVGPKQRDITGDWI